MTNIEELYDICSRENITIDFIDCPKCGAISLFGAGGCAIGIDSQTPARLLKERTAHEIGHCVKGAKKYTDNELKDMLPDPYQ